MSDKLKKIIIIFSVAILLGGILLGLQRCNQLHPAKFKDLVTITDSVVVPSRQCGYVNLDLLEQTVSDKCPGHGLKVDGHIINNKVTVTLDDVNCCYLLGDDRAKSQWLKYFKDLKEIEFLVEDGIVSFTTLTIEQDGTTYIYIPYQMLRHLFAR